MLIAITIVLGYVSGYLRIGTAIKFSISFISVYFSAVVFGPFIGGFVGAAADFMSYIFNPTGGYLWPLMLIEFAYGFIFGMLFHSRDGEKVRMSVSVAKVIFCTIIVTVINIFGKSYVLMQAGYVPSPIATAITIRLPASLVMAAVHLVVLIVAESLMPRMMGVICKK